MVLTFCGNDPQGWAGSNLNVRESVGMTTELMYPVGSPQGRTTPSRIEMLGSPRTSPGLTSLFVPRPPQFGQAP